MDIICEAFAVLSPAELDCVAKQAAVLADKNSGRVSALWNAVSVSANSLLLGKATK